MSAAPRRISKLPERSDLCLLSNLKRVIYLDTQVSDCRLELGVPMMVSHRVEERAGCAAGIQGATSCQLPAGAPANAEGLLPVPSPFSTNTSRLRGRTGIDVGGVTQEVIRRLATSVRYSSRKLKKLRLVSTEPAAAHKVLGMEELAGLKKQYVVAIDSLGDRLKDLSEVGAVMSHRVELLEQVVKDQASLASRLKRHALALLSLAIGGLALAQNVLR